ncbi:serine hydrolase domain-containing protein [Catenovulum sediminis]|uniref:Serine hydrolase n=1 Tax=Catenovulum sediminis TaxID=1740262 RepID=A0ABV1RLX2_9ALTE|nr:serine hydrolase [Catenovulum sediminis]
MARETAFSFKKLIWLLLFAIPLSLAVLLFAAAYKDMKSLHMLEKNRSAFPKLFAQTTIPAEKGGFSELHSLLIYHKSQILFEQYYVGNQDYIDFSAGIKRIHSQRIKQWQQDDLHYIASVNKSISALIVGSLLPAFNFTADTNVAQLLTEKEQALLSKCEAHQDLTIFDALTMQTAYQWDEWQGDDLKNLWQQADFVTYLLSQDCSSEKKYWTYNSALPNFLLSLFDRKLRQERQTTLKDWTDQNLFLPLEITEYQWFQQPNGAPEASARMFMRSRDLLKLGQLLLNQGAWQGTQIVDASWVKQMQQPHVAVNEEHYGYYLWLRDYAGYSAWVMEGDGGQYVITVPSLQLVIVITQGHYLNWPVYSEQSRRLVENFIIPQIKSMIALSKQVEM